MPELTRHLEILSLSHSLKTYARSLQSDANAALLLVHGAMARAFADGGADRVRTDGGRRGALESALRTDIRLRHDASLAGA